MAKVISRRGEEVDFELLKAKDQLNNMPKTIDVEQRERFIDKRKRRGNSRKISEMLTEQAENEKSMRDRLEEQRKLMRERMSEESTEETEPVVEPVVDDVDRPKRINRRTR